MFNEIASMLGMGWSQCKSVLHLSEELLLQLVGPALVGLGVSCQVSNVCTFQHHLRTRPCQQDRHAAAHKTTQGCSHRLHILRVQRHACTRLMQPVQGWWAVCNPALQLVSTLQLSADSAFVTEAAILVHTAQQANVAAGRTDNSSS